MSEQLEQCGSKHDQTSEWLTSQSEFAYAGEDSDESSVVESSDGEEGDDDSSGSDVADIITTQTLGTQISPSEISTISERITEMLSPVNSIQTVGNVSISNSTNVHIGNVTNINGNITIIHDRIKTVEKSGRQHSAGRDTNRPQQKQPRKTHTNSKPAKDDADEREECVGRDAFISGNKLKIPKAVFSVIPRCNWLAQRPLEDYEYIAEPVEYIVVSHTATESSLKQAINIRTIRHIQCFHIESHGWNDIAYNFLIGCDGNIYEGRGWGVVGAHTKGYNTCALGISFIGCFMRELPTEAALNACQNLLKKGVQQGHLAANYKMICHCQCRPTESPGRKLFEELQKWDHFYNIEDDEHDVNDDDDDPDDPGELLP